MQLQNAEDVMLEQIQTVLALTPEAAPQLEKFISPSIRYRLEHSGLRQTTQRSIEDGDPSHTHSVEEGQKGLVPFVRGVKEARKPSYGIR